MIPDDSVIYIPKNKELEKIVKEILQRFPHLGSNIDDVLKLARLRLLQQNQKIEAEEIKIKELCNSKNVRDLLSAMETIVNLKSETTGSDINKEIKDDDISTYKKIIKKLKNYNSLMIINKDTLSLIKKTPNLALKYKGYLYTKDSHNSVKRVLSLNNIIEISGGLNNCSPLKKVTISEIVYQNGLIGVISDKNEFIIVEEVL